MEKIKRDGHGVVRKYFTEEFCNDALTELHDELELAHERFSEELGIYISRTYITGELNALGIAHLSSVWYIRKEVKKLISSLVGSTNLLCSMEGYINYRKEFQNRQSLHQLNEIDAINKKRWRCIVMMTDCSPVNGGVMIQAKTDNELKYVPLNKGDVLVFDPYRIMHKFVTPQVVKEEWSEVNGIKHSLKTVSSELCMLPITYQESVDVKLSIINQRMSSALNKRSTLGDISQPKRRALANSTTRQYEQRYIIPSSFVEPHQLPADQSMIQFRYDNDGRIDWYLLDKEITSLIRGEDYKEK